MPVLFLLFPHTHWDGWNNTRTRAQSELFFSLDYQFGDIVFVTLPPWILMAVLHRIANGLITFKALFIHTSASGHECQRNRKPTPPVCYREAGEAPVLL